VKKIAILASGSGSNAEKIIQYFEGRQDVEIALILTNNPCAKVCERAEKYQIPVLDFDRATFYESNQVLHALQEKHIDFLVLAGFLWLIPDNLLKAFPNKIINIHPALLPKFGGKGMYGAKVHAAVVEAKEKESGITIHYVNEKYDEGEVIFQARCNVAPEDTPEQVAQKVQLLEHEHFPKIIDKILMSE
jgi:phosphoribosylglycinamide formyltransferase 1